ncbi:hypothetical protein BGZ83_001156, partial [Gryganskiella cystojenkinii]
MSDACTAYLAHIVQELKDLEPLIEALTRAHHRQGKEVDLDRVKPNVIIYYDDDLPKFWTTSRSVITSCAEGVHNVFYAFIIVLGCTLKLSFIGNSIAIEKDWAMIISDGHLEQLLPTMRRIDHVCKTLSQIFIGFLLSASSLVITLVICAWTAVSTMAEYILISQLYRNVPGLSIRSPHNPTSPSTEEEAPVPISIREYVQHRTFLATLALGMLYMNVLSFGGTMTSYLVLIGYSSRLLGVMKAVAGIMASLAP